MNFQKFEQYQIDLILESLSDSIAKQGQIWEQSIEIDSSTHDQAKNKWYELNHLYYLIKGDY